MKDKIKDFRNGIFSLRTRRFGNVAEFMIEKLYDLSPPKNKFHDRYDENNDCRIEIKFSVVTKPSNNCIQRENIIDECINSSKVGINVLKSNEIHQFSFDCNIQQVKPSEFDILFYGLFFKDKIAIFSMSTNDVNKCLGWSDKQHKGNVGEGQFHINNKTIDFHFKNHFKGWLTYKQLYELFSQKK